MTKYMGLVLLVFLLSSCTTSLFYNLGKEQTISSSLVNFLDPQSEPKEPNKIYKPQVPILKLPVNIGIAFVPASKNSSLSLTANKKYELLLNVKNEFIKHDYIDRIEIIPDMYLEQGNGFSTLQQISRLYDVEIMALVSYDQVTRSNENNVALLYWTIAGLYLIPGNDNATQTFVDTAVFDIKSQKMLLRAPGVNKLNAKSTAIGVKGTIEKNSEKGFELAVIDMIGNLNAELEVFKERIKSEKIAIVESRKGYSGGGSVGALIILFLLSCGVLRLRFRCKLSVGC